MTGEEGNSREPNPKPKEKKNLDGYVFLQQASRQTDKSKSDRIINEQEREVHSLQKTAVVVREYVREKQDILLEQEGGYQTTT